MSDLIKIWLEFLEVAIHNILYHRKLYSHKIFTLKKKYNVPVHICTHPQLNDYISNVLHAANYLAQKNQLDDVYLNISDKDGHPVENYVFNIMRLDYDDTLVGGGDDPFLLGMENMMRSFCLKIGLSNAGMSPLPEDAVFELLLKLKDCHFISNDEDPCFQSFLWMGESDEKSQVTDGKITPLQTVKSDFLHMEILIVEQSSS